MEHTRYRRPSVRSNRPDAAEIKRRRAQRSAVGMTALLCVGLPLAIAVSLTLHRVYHVAASYWVDLAVGIGGLWLSNGLAALYISRIDPSRPPPAP